MNDKKVIIRLVKLAMKYKSKIIELLLCLICSTLISLVVPMISKELIDEGFVAVNFFIIKKTLVMLLVIEIVSVCLDLYKEKRRIQLENSIREELLKSSFYHMLRLEIKYFRETNYTEMLNILETDINSMANIADESLFFAITQIFSIIGGIIGLYIISYKLLFIVLISLPIKYVISKLFSIKQKKMTKNQIDICRDYANWFGDTLGGISEIKNFRLENTKEEEFISKQKKIINGKMKLTLLLKYNDYSDIAIKELIEVLIYFFGAIMIVKDNITVGSIFAFIAYSSYVTNPISSILNIQYMLAGILPSAKRFYEFMDLETENYQGEEIESNYIKMIEFKDVIFSYTKDVKILNSISFLIKSGNKIAIMGKNGSGKSTIVSLLLRFYKLDSGKILLNNKNINHIKLDEFRNLFSIVSQDIYLFNNTIRYNIKLDSNIDDNEMLNIMCECGLESFADIKMLDYIVGTGGTMLSGGQKQKIALVRAIIRNKPVIIFDEATANIDRVSEIKLAQLLETRLKDKIVIIITHKTDILKYVNQVFYINTNGKIEDITEKKYGDYSYMTS